MIVARVILLAVGVAVGAFGVFLALTSLAFPELVALTVWLAAIVVVHDGLLAPTVSWMRARWYRSAPERPRVVTAVVHVGFVVGGILTLFVVPEVWAQGRGNPNPTILVGDYALRLLGVWALIGTVVLVVARVSLRRSRR